MLPYKVNFDYEYQLFDSHYEISKYQKFNKEWEFLYWISGETAPLISCRTYSADYLSFIEDFTGHKPIFSNNQKFEYWVGNIEEQYKKVNSRFTSTQFATENNFAHPLTSINKIPDYEGDYLIKSEGGLSGRSFKKNAIPKGDYIFDPLLKRIFDFSILFVHGKAYFYQNIIDDKFQYKGTRIFNKNKFELQTLNELYPHSTIWNDFEEKIEKIFNYYESMIPNEIWNIDSFLYEESGEVKMYLLSEVNFRKTMGYCFVKMMELFKTDKNTIEFLINPKESKGEVIQLSPEDNQFKLVLDCY